MDNRGQNIVISYMPVVYGVISDCSSITSFNNKGGEMVYLCRIGFIPAQPAKFSSNAQQQMIFSELASHPLISKE